MQDSDDILTTGQKVPDNIGHFIDDFLVLGADRIAVPVAAFGVKHQPRAGLGLLVVVVKVLEEDAHVEVAISFAEGVHGRSEGQHF